MKKTSSKTALITGGTLGIGYEIAKLFAADGYDLVLVARNEEQLRQRKTEFETAYGNQVRVLAFDLAKPSSPGEIHALLEKETVPVDVLVNNAGFGANGSFSDLDLPGQLNMIRVNCTALTELTGLFLPQMIARNSGKVLNVSSIAGFQPGPSMAVYYATKAFVTSFSEAIRHELRKTEITICTFCPGPTRTEFGDRAGFKNVIIMDRNSMSAEEVAKLGYNALQKNKGLYITGLSNRLLMQAQKFFPRKLVLYVVEGIQKSRH